MLGAVLIRRLDPVQYRGQAAAIVVRLRQKPYDLPSQTAGLLWQIAQALLR